MKLCFAWGYQVMRDGMETNKMKIEVFAADSQGPEPIENAFRNWIAGHDAQPNFVALHQSVPTRGLGLENHFPGVAALHGATSCLGVMSESGPHISRGAGAFAIWDANGDYGTALRKLGSDPYAAAKAATEAALLAADRPGEAPDIIWLSVSPGREEDVLAAIEDVVGDNVPVMGGSAADDTVSGDWQVFDGKDSVADGVIVSVLFPSKPISFAYHNGYAPTSHTGVITKAEGRLLKEIDHRPVAEVYSDWTEGNVIPNQVAERCSILSESTWTPLGRHCDSVGGVPFYLLFHPAAMTPDGSFELFADAKVGETLTLMKGSADQLTYRAGKVAALAAQSGKLTADEIAGVLMVYCGGCMMAVQDKLSDVSAGICEALPGVPFLGIYTFGEQGMAMGGQNRHGNLMISAIVFAK